MIILSQYRIQKEENGIFKMVDMPSFFCDICGEKMKVKDSRLRRLLDADGDEHWLRHRRLCCRECKRIHSEFPDFVMPGKHYAAYVILEQFFSIFTEQTSGTCSAENNTIRRWVLEINCQVWMIFSFLWELFRKREVKQGIIMVMELLEVLLDKNLNFGHYQSFIKWLYIFEPHIHIVLL